MLLNILCLSKGVFVKEMGAIELICYLFVPLLFLLFLRIYNMEESRYDCYYYGWGYYILWAKFYF